MNVFITSIEMMKKVFKFYWECDDMLQKCCKTW